MGEKGWIHHTASHVILRTPAARRPLMRKKFTFNVITITKCNRGRCFYEQAALVGTVRAKLYKKKSNAQTITTVWQTRLIYVTRVKP